MESRQVSGRQSIHYRNYRRARDKALVRLAHLYPDTYKQLLSEQRSFDEQEGKNWIIDSNSRLTVGIHTRANAANDLTFTSTSTSTGNTGENEGDNGGEA
jgi:hypothetical protein